MKKLATVLLSASVLTCMSFSAQAQQSWPNWYIGLHGSLAFVGEESVSGNAGVSEVDIDQGYAYGVSLGYRPAMLSGEWSNLRGEVQWHSQMTDVDSVSTPGGSVAGGGDVRVNAGLFNLYYDVALEEPQFRPYVGAGLGFAEVKLRNSGAAFAGDSTSDNVFAWNLLAGIGYVPTWMPFTELNVGYRYLATTDAEFGLAGGGNYELEYDSHNVEAGVKFLF